MGSSLRLRLPVSPPDLSVRRKLSCPCRWDHVRLPFAFRQATATPPPAHKPPSLPTVSSKAALRSPSLASPHPTRPPAARTAHLPALSARRPAGCPLLQGLLRGSLIPHSRPAWRTTPAGVFGKRSLAQDACQSCSGRPSLVAALAPVSPSAHVPSAALRASPSASQLMSLKSLSTEKTEQEAGTPHVHSLWSCVHCPSALHRCPPTLMH